ncbi:MAG: CHRD domain-containing protein [Chromatiaceae bacterium]|nr:CHRD domain-containing protein [Chromatiaceae bacterium]MCP5422995.1 CHRD domain-containing protein [Chromatiaceae bacterium]
MGALSRDRVQAPRRSHGRRFGAVPKHANTVLEAVLAGREKLAGGTIDRRIVGDPNDCGEACVFGVDGDPSTLCYGLSVDRIQRAPVAGGMAGHMHEGERGENGPVVALLAGPEEGNAADCLTEGEPGEFPTGESRIVQYILSNPAQLCLNVHNPADPVGAIRGQLEHAAE